MNEKRTIINGGYVGAPYLILSEREDGVRSNIVTIIREAYGSWNHDIMSLRVSDILHFADEIRKAGVTGD